MALLLATQGQPCRGPTRRIGCGTTSVHTTTGWNSFGGGASFTKTRYEAFLRHDNQHEGWLYPGHGDPHHVHVLDWRTGDEKPGSPFWCGQEGWPTLGEFIQKVELWYYDNLPQLPNPYRVAELGLRG